MLETIEKPFTFDRSTFPVNVTGNQKLFDYRLFGRPRFYDPFGGQTCIITTKTKQTQSIKSTGKIKT